MATGTPTGSSTPRWSRSGPAGYDATSLDALAGMLDIRKQTILYWFPTKEAVLGALIERSTAELAEAFEAGLEGAGAGWDRVEAVVRAVFRLAARRPELLGLVREVTRLGPPAATQMIGALDPLVQRASGFLEAEMAPAGCGATTRGCSYWPSIRP